MGVVIQDFPRSLPSSAAVECRDIVDVAAILHPEVHVAIWRRPVDPRIVDFLMRAECTFETPSRLVEHSADLDAERHVARLLPDRAREADPIGASACANDIHELCDVFAELLCADELLLSIENPHDATCPRFHVDHVGIRMLVTYVGPGTEWLPHEHVDRRWLGIAGEGRPDDQNGVMIEGAEIQQASPFDVVLLKGEAWPDAAGFGAVHRSPDPHGRRRVMLRVDMLSQTPR